MNQWKVLRVALWLCLAFRSIAGLLQRKQLQGKTSATSLHRRTQYGSQIPEDAFSPYGLGRESKSCSDSWVLPEFAQIQQPQWQVYPLVNATNSFSVRPEYSSNVDISDFQFASTTTKTSTSSMLTWGSWRIPSLTIPVISIPLLLTQCRFMGALFRNVVRQWWWSSPMTLAALPACSWALFQKALLTPEWWKMTCMEYIRGSPDALWVVSIFLLSNISYFLVSACFFGMSKEKAMSKMQSTPSLERETNEPTIYRDLGIGVALCGAISAFFHTLQAMGTSVWAEAACYMDHGFALTTFLYFWRVCGSPFQRKRVWVTGVVGLGALSIPAKPGYAWLHSSWHVLSAITALLWGFQKKSTQL